MSEIQAKKFNEPNEIISQPKLSGQIVLIGEMYVGRYVHKPGWHWEKDVKPMVGTFKCQHHHQGIVESGYMKITTIDGGEKTIGPGEVFDIPPGHDAWVIGDEPFITIEFRGARDWAKPSVSGERVLVTMLFTDIVNSTAIASEIGDAAWKELKAKHYEKVRLELERFRGYEIETTGDGFFAIFDGTARAVHCASAICNAARRDGIMIRAGVHSGEVERHTDKIHGVAVHIASRIMSLAGPDEVLISGSTAALLEGSGIRFSDAGEHELKGLKEKRRVFRLIENNIREKEQSDLTRIE